VQARRWQRASSARCLQNKARGLTTSRSSKPPFCGSVDSICAEIEVSQRCALRQHSFKALCILYLHVTARQFECAIAAPACHQCKLPQTNCSFSASVPLRVSSQKLLLKRTMAGRRILSTTSLTLFEVLLSMIVLPAAQVLHQSSAGMASRAVAKASAASSNGRVCVA
jgi:hypothetical protein